MTKTASKRRLPTRKTAPAPNQAGQRVNIPLPPPPLAHAAGNSPPPAVGSIPIQQDAQSIWRNSPGAWFEAFGYVYDKQRNLRSSETALRKEDLLILNRMQQELDEIVAYCAEHGIPCRIVTLKGRQQGSSTWSTAALYHWCRRRRTKACIIGDVYERSVANLLAMFNLFAQHDKFPWGSTYRAPSRTFSNGSQLTTETANANRAGASGTLQAVLCTEVAHWLETPGISAKSVFAALLSCVPNDPDTLVIVESTPNGVGGVYYDTYKKAITFEELKAGHRPHDWNGFISVFYPWHEHKEYQLTVTEAEEAEIMDTLSTREEELVEEFAHIRGGRLKWRRMKINSPDFNGDEERFEQEYPSDPERCFLLSGRRSFPLLPLQQMLKRAEREGQAGNYPRKLQWADPAETVAAMSPCSDEDAWIKIWEEPKPGYRYSISCDPATGEASGNDPDNHGFGVWRQGFYEPNGRWHAPKLVARLTDFLAEKRLGHVKAYCQWDIALCEQRIAMASAYYGWCPIVVEMNLDRGLINLLRLRSRVNLYRRVKFNRVDQTPTEEYGWETTTKTRGPIIETLKHAIRTWQKEGGGVDILDVPTLKEMMTMVIDKKGKELAMSGHHDDQVLQCAIGLQTLPVATMMPFPFVRTGPQRDPSRGGTFRA
jgi:hypothetical protein